MIANGSSTSSTTVFAVSAISSKAAGWFVSRNGNRLSRFDALADQVAAALDINDAILDVWLLNTYGTSTGE